MSVTPELPTEVLDRLAGCEAVRVQVGLLGSNAALPAVAVPLRGQLYVLFRPSAGAREQMESTPVATLLAEAPDASWSILARGRLLPGRTALSDSRRNELAHWVPDGQPGAWMAARFYAEALDYQRELPSGRQRASGPLPGVNPFVRWRYHLDLAFEPFQVWFLISGALIAAGILYLDAEDAGTPLVLLLALAAAQLPVMATRLLLAPIDLERWRNGEEDDASLGLLAEARLAPREFRADGAKFAVAAAVAWIVLAYASGPAVTALVSLLSGAPVLVLAMAVRRRFRRSKEDRG